MTERERILQQIRDGRQMVVGQGGSTIRPANDTTASEVPVKPHRWGRL